MPEGEQNSGEPSVASEVRGGDDRSRPLASARASLSVPSKTNGCHSASSRRGPLVEG